MFAFLDQVELALPIKAKADSGVSHVSARQIWIFSIPGRIPKIGEYGGINALYD